MARKNVLALEIETRSHGVCLSSSSPYGAPCRPVASSCRWAQDLSGAERTLEQDTSTHMKGSPGRLHTAGPSPPAFEPTDSAISTNRRCRADSSPPAVGRDGGQDGHSVLLETGHGLTTPTSCLTPCAAAPSCSRFRRAEVFAVDVRVIRCEGGFTDHLSKRRAGGTHRIS